MLQICAGMQGRGLVARLLRSASSGSASEQRHRAVYGDRPPVSIPLELRSAVSLYVFAHPWPVSRVIFGVATAVSGVVRPAAASVGFATWVLRTVIRVRTCSLRESKRFDSAVIMHRDDIERRQTNAPLSICHHTFARTPHTYEN